MQTHRVAFGKLVFVMGGALLVALGALSRTTSAFNPQPEPPAFGLVNLVAGQDLRINIVCSEHGARRVPPGPCTGELMFHDADGNTLSSQQVRLSPGQSTSVALGRLSERNPGGIDPCWIPGPDNTGFAIPSAEVFSIDTGQTQLYLNPVVSRLSDLATAR